MKKYDQYVPEHRSKEADFYSKVSKAPSYEERYHEHKKKNYEWQKKTKKLSREEVTKMYWNHLAKVGWKFYKRRNEDWLVLSCEECDYLIGDMMVETLTLNDVRGMEEMTSAKSHVCESKAIPEA